VAVREALFEIIRNAAENAVRFGFVEGAPKDFQNF